LQDVAHDRRTNDIVESVTNAALLPEIAANSPVIGALNVVAASEVELKVHGCHAVVILRTC
jgi:hypothetical protein